MYLTRTGCAWRMLPKDFPPWQTVYGYFRDWRKDGTLDRVHALREQEDQLPTIKERLHKLVDELSDREADDALRYIAEHRRDPMIAAFRDAPEDDQPVSAVDEEALADVHADRAAGARQSRFAEIKRKYGHE